MFRIPSKPAVAAMAFLFLLGLAQAQTVNWTPNGGTIHEGKTYTINLSFDGCSPDGQPPQDLSSQEMSVVLGGGMQTFTSNVFGSSRSRSSVRVEYSYQIRANQTGTVTIPEFEVKTDQGEFTVPEARFEVVEANVGNTGTRPDEVLLSRFTINDDHIYQGEVFTINYFAGARRFRLTDIGQIDWTPKGLVTSGLKAIEQGAYQFDGDSYNAVRYEGQAMATRAGTLVQDNLKQDIEIAVGQRNRGFFPETVTEVYPLKVDPLTIEILPLPENAPESFSGAVGDFELTSRVMPSEVSVGEPVTWTLELSGKGNWPDGIGVPSRSVSSSFRAIKPDLKNEFSEEDLFSGTQIEDVVLIPTTEGAYQLGPLNFSYFDPQKEAYETITIPATTVQVAGTTSGQDGTGAGQQETRERTDSPTIALDPTGENTASRSPSIPKDPVASVTVMPIPTGSINLWQPTLWALAVPALLWTVLAAVNTWILDPSRQRREAFKQMKALLRQAPVDDPDELRAQQHAWRQQARAYWTIDTCEPTPDEVAAAVRRRLNESAADKWRILWKESDRILYSGRQSDAERWMTLFRDALESSPRPRRDLSPFFTRPAWLGALIFALAVFSPSDAAHADDGRTYYDAGEFEKAEATWVEAINSQPGAWEPRYNAGLAAAQQQEWGRAWGYWAGAFCLNPREERIAWNLRVAQTHTDAYDPILLALLEKDGVYGIVGARSPAQWERLARQLLWAAGTVFCLAALARYWKPSRRAALPLLLIGVVFGLAAYFSQWAHSKYESLALPSSILITEATSLRSIPTDLGESQIETSVSEGTVARFQKDFVGLGWSKLALPNGDEGWMRKEGFLPLYGPISSGPDA